GRHGGHRLVGPPLGGGHRLLSPDGGRLPGRERGPASGIGGDGALQRFLVGSLGGGQPLLRFVAGALGGGQRLRGGVAGGFGVVGPGGGPLGGGQVAVGHVAEVGGGGLLPVALGGGGHRPGLGLGDAEAGVLQVPGDPIGVG